MSLPKDINDKKSQSYVSVGNDQTAIRTVETHKPSNKSSFGDFLADSLDPIEQISAQYGLLNNVETFDATGGSVSTVDNMFTCTTGTSIGGYGVIRSKGPTIYREGQGLMARFTALFDANAVANSLQFAGLFNVQDTIAFGYRGTDFGILFDSYGAQEAHELIITTMTTGNLELTLNSILYTIPVTTGTNAHNAYEIEAWMKANQSVWDAEQIEDKVILRSKSVGVKAGTYSATGAGFTGSLPQVTTGTAKVESTILQTDWNGDTFSFDPTKGNIYMIKVSYLGFGPISFFIMDSAGDFRRVHTINYQNNNIKPSISNRALKVGWTAASLGSTTDLTVQGASAGTFIEGKSRIKANAHAQSFSNTAVGTSFESVITLKSREVLNGKANLGKVNIIRLELSTDSTKEVVVKVCRDAVLGQTNFVYHDELDSVVTYDTTIHADSLNGANGAHAVYETQIGSSGANSVDLKTVDLAFVSGETITVYAKVVSGSASDVTASLVWKEDL